MRAGPHISGQSLQPVMPSSGEPKGFTLVHKDSPGDEPDRGPAGFPTGSDEAGNEASETRGGRCVPYASA